MRLQSQVAIGLIVVMLFSLVSVTFGQSSKGRALSESQKIDRLIRAVGRQQSAVFVGERFEYYPSKASAALEVKKQLDSNGAEFETAREFIKFIIEPNTHDAPYMVRFTDGSSMSMEEYLTTLLKQIEAGERPGVKVEAVKNENKPEPNIKSATPHDPEHPDSPQEVQLMWGMINGMKRRTGAEVDWPATKFIRWTHFGDRTHIWDKTNNRDRVEFVDDAGARHVVVINLNDGSGKAWVNDAHVTEPESLTAALDAAMDMCVNDHFWMFAHFLINEPGTNLEYIRRERLPDDRMSHVIEVTFDSDKFSKGAPHEKYRIYIGHDTLLIEQWECFAKADDVAPDIIGPWTDWQPYGSILLASQRGIINGKQAMMSDVAVYATMPESVFTEPGEPALPAAVPVNETFVQTVGDAMSRANADAVNQPTSGGDTGTQSP